MTTAQLRGFYAPDFVPDGRQHYAVGSWPPGMEGFARTVDIADARALQAKLDLPEAEFFARYGFVLLPHASAVQDWNTDVASLYLPEIRRIVCERLLPGRRLELQLGANLLRRGRGTPVPFYAEGVHSDGGLDLDDFVKNIDAFARAEAAQYWRTRYERDDVAGLVWIDFWRPTNMRGPLDHMPLALCDSVSLGAEDIIPTAMTGIAPEGRETNHLSLRFNPEQRWFYYPQMTCEEVLAFKLVEFWKEPTPVRNCFHSAFRDAAAPADAEERQSCELRVGVLVLKD